MPRNLPWKRTIGVGGTAPARVSVERGSNVKQENKDEDFVRAIRQGNNVCFRTEERGQYWMHASLSDHSPLTLPLPQHAHPHPHLHRSRRRIPSSCGRGSTPMMATAWLRMSF